MTEQVALFSHSDIQRYIFGGRAVFTLKSRRSGDHFTYKVRRRPHNLYYVYALKTGFEYIGLINPAHFFIPDKRTGVTLDDIQVRALKWTIDNVVSGKTPRELEFYHEGRCARCARRLTDPESIKSGFGPECMNIVCN